MKALVVYHSQYGNTERVAQAIAASLNEVLPTEAVSVDKVTPQELVGLDLLVVGGPTQMHGASHELMALLKSLPHDSLLGVKAATFDTRSHTMKLLSGSAADVAAHHLSDAGCQLVIAAESFFITGKEGPLAEGELTRASEWGREVAGMVTDLLSISHS